MFNFFRRKKEEKEEIIRNNTKLAEKAEDMIVEFDKKHNGGKSSFMFGHLTGFEQYQIFGMLVNPQNKPVICTGNWENAALEEYAHLVNQIKKHPYLWKFFQL